MAIICDPPDSPSNGNVIGSQYQYGDNVTYTCNEGFVLVGDSYQTCQADRTWSGSVPVCIFPSPSPSISSTAVTSTNPLVPYLPIITTTSFYSDTSNFGTSTSLTTSSYSDTLNSVDISTVMVTSSYSNTDNVGTSSIITSNAIASINAGVIMKGPTRRSTKLGTSSTPVIAVTFAPDKVNSPSHLVPAVVGSVLSMLVFAATVAIICMLVALWRKKRQQPTHSNSKMWFFGGISNPTGK